MSKSIREHLATPDSCYVSTTSGYSMWPMLRDRRDRVVIRSVDGQRLARHELPLYVRPDGTYVLHRILARRDGYYVIRGDNTFVRERVPQEWVIGYVTEFYRGDRHVTVDSRAYRAYVVLWRLIFPLRLAWHFLRRALGAIRRRVRGLLGRTEKTAD